MARRDFGLGANNEDIILWCHKDHRGERNKFDTDNEEGEEEHKSERQQG